MTAEPRITPALLLKAYRHGIFPMAESRDAAEIFWLDPERRGILPIASLRVPSRLRRTVRQNPYRITFDRDFAGVIRRCAAAREKTWINDEIISLYTALHRQGHAHSVEAWQGEALAGGLYGIAQGGAFFGESMFSAERDSSKIALVWLAARLWRQGYSLLDAQFVNDHLKQFGVVEVSRDEYHARLKAALAQDCRFDPAPYSSKEDGISSSAGGAVSPSSRSPAGTGASGSSSTGASAAGSSCGFSGGAASCGLLSGSCSDVNDSGFPDVLLFLQSITQTS